MTTLRKLSAQARKLLSAGTQPKDSKLRDRYVQEEIRQIAHKMMKLEFFTTKNDGGSDVYPLGIATYSNVTVQNDTTIKRNYIDLPAFPMNLPGGVGVQQVRPQTGVVTNDRAMIPIMPHELELFSSLLVGAEILKDQWCFEVDRDRILFTERNNKTFLTAFPGGKVELKMVVLDPDQIDEDDNLPVPPEMEFDILKEVLVLHGYTPTQAYDMVNDSNPNSK